MDSFQIFRNAISSGNPPGDLFAKPSSPDPVIDSAVWRFLKSWKSTGRLGSDEAVLFRQVMRWGRNETHLPGIGSDFRELLKNCSVEIDSVNIVNATPFRPTWIEGDVIPEEGIDSVPVYRQERERIKAEQYLRILKYRSAQGQFHEYDHWKSPAQKEAAWLTLNSSPGSTNLIVLPTGMGKSLCFQLLPIFTSGLTVVVVPTIALAIDQCASARDAFRDQSDVNPQYFASDGTDSSPSAIVDMIETGKTRLVFTSPEACVSGRLNSCLDHAAKNGILQSLVVDEAHLISSWGMYFRVEFQLLAGLRRKWVADTQGRLRTFLFTATITQSEKLAILDLFSDGEGNNHEFLFHSLRPEIRYFDQHCHSVRNQSQAMEECLWHLPRPAIIYTTKVDAAEQLYREFRDKGFQRVGCFTGNTRANNRRSLLDRWRQDGLDLMVATSAFGLGVDKPDVRTVIHCCFPEDLNRFYQEVGRGGRDGYSSISVLIPNDGDIGDAKGMKPKLLNTDLIQKRWRAMWDTRQEINAESHDWKIRLNTKHPKLLGDRTYQENVKWNKRLVLQLVRANRIHIHDMTFDSELSKELGEFQEYISLKLKDGFNPDSPSIGHAIKHERELEAEASSLGFRRLKEYMSSERCISRILKELYGEDTHRSCGGCRWCRKENREPTTAPIFEYSLNGHSGPVRIVEGCDNPRSGNKRGFIRTIRRAFESGIRRFACSSEEHGTLLDLFDRSLSRQALFRLDAIAKDCDFSLLAPEDLLVIHLDKPFRSLVKIGGTASTTHLLCGSLTFMDIRYLLPYSAANPQFFASPSMLFRG